MWLVAVNPSAGNGRTLELSREVTGFLQLHDEESRVLIAPNAAELSLRLRDVVAEAEGHIKGIISIGGDGLAHLVLQIAVPARIPFVVIPGGTGNDFARSLGYSRNDVMTLLRKVISNPAQPVDLGNVDSEWFGAILSTGFDSVVNERANSLRWPKGAARYNAAIALELPKFRAIDYELTIDGSTMPIQAMLIAVGNGRSYGAGMNICPNAQLHDGLFDLVILEPVSTVEFIKVFPQVYSGKHINHPQVRSIRAKKVRIEGASIAYADGERIGPAPVSAECIAGAGLTWTL
jgi:diacylglycerol kinase (ATP)